MSLEDLFKLMDAFTGKNKLIDEEKKIETAYWHLIEMIILKKIIQMEKLSITERKTGKTRR